MKGNCQSGNFHKAYFKRDSTIPSRALGTLLKVASKASRPRHLMFAPNFDALRNFPGGATI